MSGMSFTRRLAVFTMLAALPVVAAAQRDAPPRLTPAARAELTRLEKLVASNPDSLRAGAQYRRVVIETWQHDRAHDFFDRLLKKNASSANLLLTAALARADEMPRLKIPGIVSAGRKILELSTRSLALRSYWGTHLVRGRVLVGASRVPMGKAVRAPGIADLERARGLRVAAKPCTLQVQIFTTLGDAYWLDGRPDDAQRVWQEGAALFEDSDALVERLSGNKPFIETLVDRSFSPWKRADTGTSAPCEDE
jgi:hypothetical protein